MVWREKLFGRATIDFRVQHKRRNPQYSRFEGKSRLSRQNSGTLENIPREKLNIPRPIKGTVEKLRGKIESTEAEFRYPRKFTEAEFWLMLHPGFEDNVKRCIILFFLQSQTISPLWLIKFISNFQMKHLKMETCTLNQVSTTFRSKCVSCTRKRQTDGHTRNEIEKTKAANTSYGYSLQVDIFVRQCSQYLTLRIRSDPS